MSTALFRTRDDSIGFRSNDALCKFIPGGRVIVSNKIDIDSDYFIFWNAAIIKAYSHTSIV